MSLVLNVRNFLSLRDVSITFDYLNVLVGPNASGKSNIIRALEFVSKFIKSGKVAIDTLFGDRDFSDVTFHGGGGQIAFELKFRDVNYVLKMEPGSLLEEVYHGSNLIFKRASSINKEQISYLDPSGSWKSIVNSNASRSIAGQISIPTYQFSKQNNCHNLESAISILASIGVYSFDPEFIKTRSHAATKLELGKKGNNLARLLFHYYLADKFLFRNIVETFTMLAPDVEEIVPISKGDIISLFLKEKNSDKLIDFEFASGGYLKMLAILASLMGENIIVAYDDIESFIDRCVYDTIMYIIKKFGRIVIMTTHSPHLLDYVEPKNIILVSKINGETKVRRLTDSIDVEAIKACR
ncbi:MAG: AAA family ATPase [Candidatus Korarchaeota archaeon]